ncbi:flagellar basal body L-ring protein FlgH [Novosphingobium sp. B 225]|uniref:flagellar basal body L-ring protein FlgH n=1 Tax=Novosphingobium sp. B 225 TaxID=1961849 RepID=UPI00159544FB|nr:flagellar basal body L-ring protein FlgH [Novosphingobium sp. B 225]
MRSPALMLLGLLAAAPALADDLYKGSNWTALASDRKASAVGDLLTVLIITNNTASNTVAKGTKRDTAMSGNVTFGNTFDKSAGLSFGGSYDGQGSTTRADRIAAQLSATVDQVLPNGDLMISGWQQLKVNGETTNVKVSGRVRPSDIDGGNQVLSSRIADAQIDYDGKGFASRSAKPGIVTRIFRFLGLM